VLLNGKANTERDRSRDLQYRCDNMPEGAEFSEEEEPVYRHTQNEPARGFPQK
jgi:hypothetical protein